MDAFSGTFGGGTRPSVMLSVRRIFNNSGFLVKGNDMKRLYGKNSSISWLALRWLAVSVSLAFVPQAMAVNYPPASSSISGSLLTMDKVTGDFVVEATDYWGWSREATVGTTDYLLGNLLAYRSYYVTAFRDSNSNGVRDVWEEHGSRSGIYVSIQRSGVNITMTGQDSDGDGMPDWWEFEYFGAITGADPSEDSDGDGLLNLAEYQNEANPQAHDTDEDGMADGWEVLHSFNPLSTADGGSADADGDGLTNVEEFERGTDPHDNNSAGISVLVVMPDGDQFLANDPELNWTDLP